MILGHHVDKFGDCDYSAYSFCSGLNFQTGYGQTDRRRSRSNDRNA